MSLLFQFGAAAVIGIVGPTRPVPQVAPPQVAPWTFVVLGHVRGWDNKLHPRLGEILGDVRRSDPDAVLLAGDMIWGDMEVSPRRRDRLVREWTELDSAIATLGVPVIRSPGNHDVNDRVTRDLYRERYGVPPASIVIRGARFLVLNSAWTPADGDTAQNRFIRGVPIDSSQRAWLEAELPRQGAYRHTFVLMHHLLWWGADSTSWWADIHPMLRSAGVRAVFTGDHGPLKYSHLFRDGIHYYQTSIGGDPPLAMLREREMNRVLEAQFDNFLEVSIAGDSIGVAVRTTGAYSTDRFTPGWYASAYRYTPPPPSLRARVVRELSSPARLAALAALAVGSALVGFLWRGRRSGK